MHFAQMVRQRNRRLRAVRVLQRVGPDEGIAVAVAADPRAHDQKRGNDRPVPEVARALVLQIGVKPGDLVEKCVPVVGDTVVDLVLHLQLGQPQHRGLPQREHLPIQPLLHGVPLTGRDLHRGKLVRCQRAAVAPLKQADDLPFAGEDALALHLGRMRGQHGAHQRIGKERAEHRAVDARFAQAKESVCDAARLRRRSGESVRAPPAILVDVLGEVGEMRKIAERAHDIERLRDRQIVEHRGELVLDVRRVVLARAAQADRGLADRLDPRESLLAGLMAQHVAEKAAEQARVFLERQVLVGGSVHRSSA